MRAIALIALLSLPLLAHAQESPAGRWKTIDDASGKAKSVVEIYQSKDGSYVGKVAEILDLKDGPNPACKECSGANHDKPVKGMVILWGLKPDGDNAFSGGTVLKLDNGKTYKSKIELHADGKKLDMSGCIAFICRAQTWVRE